MKKTILLFAAFILFSLLFSAKPAEAIYVKVTFTITNVTVPVRAVAAATPLLPNTEMSVNPSLMKYEIVRNSDGVVVSAKNAAENRLRKSVAGDTYRSPAVLVFKNDGGTYTPRITLTASGMSTNIPYIDCSGIAPGSPYFVAVSTESLGSVNCQTGGSNMFLSSQFLYFNFPSI